MSSLELQRTSVLGALTDGAAPAAAEFDIAQAKPAARFSLRLTPEVASGLGSFAGFDLSQAINNLGVEGSKFSMRLGPDEWLLIAEGQDEASLLGELEQALAGSAHSLVDISHRNVALILSGPRAVDVLSTGCPLDLHRSAFSPGASTRTIFAKCEVILARLPDDTGFRVECWRSFGRYLEAYLRNSARLQGVGS